MNIDRPLINRVLPTSSLHSNTADCKCGVDIKFILGIKTNKQGGVRLCKPNINKEGNYENWDFIL